MTVSAARMKLLEVACGELHVREDAGRNRDKAGRIAEFWGAAKHSLIDQWLKRVPGVEYGDEWCAAFASWCYREAGHEMAHRYGSGFPGCGMMIRWLEEQDGWYDYREIDPKPGDLLFFDWQKLPKQLKGGISITARRAQDVVDHVGLVESVIYDDADNMIGVNTIEGNWNSGVSRATRLLSSGIILGFGIIID